MSDDQQIPGVPAVWRLVRIGKASRGDTMIDGEGDPYTCTTSSSKTVFPIIERIGPEPPQTRTVVVREYQWVQSSSVEYVWWRDDAKEQLGWQWDSTGRTREIEVPV